MCGIEEIGNREATVTRQEAMHDCSIIKFWSDIYGSETQDIYITVRVQHKPSVNMTMNHYMIAIMWLFDNEHILYTVVSTSAIRTPMGHFNVMWIFVPT